MDNADGFENEEIRRLQIFLYLIPVFGFFPACWTLYQRKGNYQQRAVSRLVVTLTLGWVLGYVLLGTEGQAMIEGRSELAGLSLLLMNGVLTSSYFLINLWLMVQLWQRQPLRLPGISRIARHLP